MRKSIPWKRTTAIAACSLMFAATAAGAFAAMPRGFSVSAAADHTYTVDVSRGYQEFDGWGLSLSWWATEIGDWTRIGSTGKEKREEISEALFGKTGLDLNIARYNIGGGDDPSHGHMSDDRNTPGWRGASKQTFTTEGGIEYSTFVADPDYAWVGEDGETLDWTETPDARQLWVLNWIQNNPARAEDYLSEFYSNSPPYWMTVSGCSSGGVGGASNLAPENNRAFVDYFLDVYEYLTSQGFILQNLQPFNEPMGGWSANGDQEGCHVEAQQKLDVLGLLLDGMEERGIEANYNIGDECETYTATKQYNAMRGLTASDDRAGSDILDGASRLTYHIYNNPDAGDGDMKEMYRHAHTHGQEVYMSEICWSSKDDKEYDPMSLKTGFEYTQSIINTVKHGGADAYVFWQGMEDMVGQMKGNTNYGLIQGVYYTQEQAEEQGVDLASMGLTYQDYVLAKSYYMSGQYTKYIRPGYRLVDVNEDNTLAAISPDGQTLVIVKQANGDGSTVHFDLNGFKATSVEKIVTDADSSWEKSYISAKSGSFEDAVSDHSVTTYVVHGTQTAGSYFVDDSYFAEKGSVEADSTAEGNLAALTAALEEGGETEQYYASGFHTNGNSSGEAKFYGNTIWANEKGYLGIRFQGTGFGIVATTKNDTGKIDYWFDADPTGEPTGTHDMYGNGGTKTQNVLYTVNDAEYGWHTVYIKVGQGEHGNYLNIDGVLLYTMKDADPAAQKVLDIETAAGVGGKVLYTYKVEGYDGYTLYPEYRTGVSGAWTRAEATTPADGEGSGELSVESDIVWLRIAAVKGEEVVYTSSAIVNMFYAADGVLYFADCGALDTGSLAEGAVLGELQSVTDKPYGKDAVTGKSWGYDTQFTGGSYYGANEAMTSMWSFDQTAGKAGPITYKFQIPEAGNYKVAVGFYGGGSGWGTRSETVTVNTVRHDNVTLNQRAYNAEYFNVTTSAADEEITVTIEKKEGEAHISAIVITEENVKLPLYTSYVSNYNTDAANTKDIYVGDNLSEMAAAENFTLYYTDGTHEDITSGTEGATLTVNAGELAMNETATATWNYKGLSVVKTYRWYQQGAEDLYYNIDCGYVDPSKSPDSMDEIGSKQSTTLDRAFAKDPEKETSWGYTGEVKNTNWTDDNQNKWSIREGKEQTYNGATKKVLTYKMTGFVPDEPLKIETGGHLYGGDGPDHSQNLWGARSYDVMVGAEGKAAKIGSISLPNSDGLVYEAFTGSSVKADEKGELIVTLMATSGDCPQCGYIKVWSSGESLPASATITADKTTALRDEEVTLRNLETTSLVYVLDENANLLGTITPEAESMTIKIEDYLPEDAYELHFTQAHKNVTSASADLVVCVPLAEIVLENELVKAGEETVIRILPHATQGVSSLTLETPAGVTFNVAEGFFYRAKENGTYTVTLVSNKVTRVQTFEVNNIDVVDFGEEISRTQWTAGNVTVTLNPTATSVVKTVEIDGAPAVKGADGKYTLTVSENGTHVVKITTEKGFEYEKTIVVSNIDKAAPTLGLSLKLTAGGIAFDYEAVSLSGGKLLVDFNGDRREITDETTFTLGAEGKYEIYFENALGIASDKAVYYVSYGAAKANLATVSLGEDGTVSVTAKARAELSYNLYRAGKDTPVEKAEKAGKYYLEIENGGEHEIVVLNVAQVAGGAAAGGDAIMIAGIAVGCAALVAAAVACALIIVKRRKNA